MQSTRRLAARGLRGATFMHSSSSLSYGKGFAMATTPNLYFTKVSRRNFGAIPSTPAPSVADEPAGPSVKTAVPGPASNEVKAKMNELQVCGEASTRVLLRIKGSSHEPLFRRL